MGVPHYLAMTAAELAVNPPGAHTAWLACHFSPYNDGLSNLPTSMPEDSMLVLDDYTPMKDHDPQTIFRQLSRQLEGARYAGVLLDFQRPDIPQEAQLAAHLAQRLPCPVGVSHLYAEGLDCPVFLPPVPAYCPLERCLQPWLGREIWLETSRQGTVLTLTASGCEAAACSEIFETGFSEEKLHCHYTIETGEDFARFTLWRTQSDLDNLLAAAEGLGVTLAVGLWQQLGG